MCERLGLHPLDFGLSKASLLAIENEFGLSIEMLPLFKFNGGGHSYHFRPSGLHDQKPEQLGKTNIFRLSYSSHLPSDQSLQSKFRKCTKLQTMASV